MIQLHTNKGDISLNLKDTWTMKELTSLLHAVADIIEGNTNPTYNIITLNNFNAESEEKKTD